MKLLQLVLVGCLVAIVLARHRVSTFNSNRQQGEPCTPRYLYTCGNRTMIGEVETEELGEDDGFMGPNVCSTTKMYRVQTYSYSYQRGCRFCGLYCYSTGVCNGTFHNITRETVACCDGFTTGDEPSTAASEGPGRGRRFSGSFYRNRYLNQLRSEGCPVMLRDNVVQCLQDLGLTSFIDQASRLQELFNSELQSTAEDAPQFTIFAPSNDALGNTAISIEGHIAESNINSKSLFGGRLIRTRAENVTLHAAVVRQSRNSEKEFFLNGALIADPDACKARNGIVHVMDSIIPFSRNTIAQVLESQSDRFSTFNSLLEGANIMRYLRDPVKSRTVFAPTNKAFEDNLPSGAVECLLREENTRYLQFLVLIHIVAPAEYSSTLVERSHVPTFAWYYLLVGFNNETDKILITRDEIPIEEEDIPANNGVIHAIPDVIVPNEIDFEKICEVEPTTPPIDIGSPSTDIPIIPGGPLPTAPVIESSGDGPGLLPIDEILPPEGSPVGDQDI